jgi:hypothetical protein
MKLTSCRKCGVVTDLEQLFDLYLRVLDCNYDTPYEQRYAEYGRRLEHIKKGEWSSDAKVYVCPVCAEEQEY